MISTVRQEVSHHHLILSPAAVPAPSPASVPASTFVQSGESLATSIWQEAYESSQGRIQEARGTVTERGGFRGRGRGIHRPSVLEQGGEKRAGVPLDRESNKKARHE